MNEKAHNKLLKSFWNSEPMRDAVKKELLRGLFAEAGIDDPTAVEKAWVFQIPTDLPDVDYAHKIKRLVSSLSILQNAFDGIQDRANMKEKAEADAKDASK